MVAHFWEKMFGLRFVVSAFCGMAVILLSFPLQANDAETKSRFSEFLAKRDYKSANFYLSSGLIDGAQLETGQIFYNIYRSVYWDRRAGSLNEVATLFNYLGSLRPIDLNARYKCNYQNHSDEESCALLNDIASGMPVAVFDFFAQRGMDLNRVYDDLIPATYDIIDRLGTVYSLADIQTLSNLGMAFGDEQYSSVKLAAFREYQYRYNRKPVVRGSTVDMPHDYLSIPYFNFMDALAIALANKASGASRARNSLRDQSLCQYIVFAASSFQPSFDYLRFILEKRDDFRATKIGVRVRDGNTTAEPFPASCVALMGGMAQNHARLDEVVSYFGAQGDVSTARWLLSLKSPFDQDSVDPQSGRPAAQQGLESSSALEMETQ